MSVGTYHAMDTAPKEGKKRILLKCYNVAVGLIYVVGHWSEIERRWVVSWNGAVIDTNIGGYRPIGWMEIPE